MARNISYEPCTLVYTLLNNDVLNFSDFNLIVRSLHSFMVEDVKPNEAANNVHVKLGYQASVINAQNKLGKLRNVVSVAKLSTHIKECEFSRLEQLRRRFGLNLNSDESFGHQPARRSNGNGARRTFKQRAAPYPKKKPATSTPDTSVSWYEDGQHLTPSLQTDEILEQSSDDNTENQQ